MTRDEMDVVSAVERGLLERIGRERYELWFSSAVQLEVHHGTLVVRAKDQFLVERLRKQFAGELAAAAREKLGEVIPVFQVDASPKCRPALREPSRQGQPDDGAKTAVILKKNGASAPLRAPRRPFARLDTFVVGEGNRVAHLAAQSVVQRPGTVSPLFLYGPTGCGKTHLLEGTWTAIRSQTSRSRVLFLSAEQFTSHFLEALQGGGLPNFRRKCREVELLAIDDVQFFAGKRATIIEFQHTIDALLRDGRQLVLAADRPPALLAELGSEMIMRFSGGLIAGMEEACYPTRLEIASRFAARLRIAVPAEVLQLTAAELGGDTRLLFGALNRLEATCLALDQPPTVGVARKIFQEVFRATQRVVRLPDIEQAVCDTFGLDPKCLRGGTKAKAVSHPRMLAMWLARKYTQAAFTEISQFFGRRSHSTVISAEKKISRWLAEGSSLQLGREACQVQDAIQRVELRLRSG